MPAAASTGDSAGGHPICSPETLYTFVVGRAPGPELGYPAERGDVHGQVAGSLLPDDPVALVDQVDDRDSGASARAKKRRKVQRRSKVSEIWFPRAEMAFCTCVTAIPPNGRTKIKFFGRPLGRNELIAAICTLATHRLYNRKQISSHSQVLKDKVPAQFKEIFTFEDKSRGHDEPSESSTANVIETYQFPDIIYSIINYPLGTDLANAPKPSWLLDLESGVNDSQAPPMDPSTPRAYNYWNAPPSQDYGSYYSRSGGGGGGYGKGKDREGRTIGGGDPYYQYSPQGSIRQSSAPYPPPHSLPPLPLPRDLEPGQGEALGSGRFSYSQGSSRARMGNGGWEDHARSPTSTSSYDAQQSQGSGVSPRQPAGPPWSDVKPQMSNADLTLPPLQEVPSPTYDWKERSPIYPEPKWGATSAQSAVRSALSPLPSFGSVASQSGGYAGGPGGWAADPPYWDSTSAIRGTNRNDSLSRVPAFTPLSIEVTADSRNGSVSLTASEPLTNGSPMPLDNYLANRYPFLLQMAQSPGVAIPVYHIDVPVTIPPNDPSREFLLDSITDIGLDLVLHCLNDASGWAVTTDATWQSAYGPNRQPRVVTPLRPLGASREIAGSVRMTRLAELYNSLLQNLRTSYYNASLGDVGVPNTDIVQRIVRDGGEDTRGSFDPQLLPPIGSDWSNAACILVYSLRVADGAMPYVITARGIDFSAQYETVSDQHIAQHILASEEQKSSSYDWIG
ncbi:hypothetical protein CcaverHIS002_0203880 [Cutaneotrichosporon cavernicola]|uniref:TEA domain-containing protein n=1 Tax=Cutaneotrichosporon cavernicola TaxID=279322 RepID=A0AA48I461_9TREE|nr:uncharacterized protein CcaverHIS019_0203840 [Cutaneotrichosporon cavernicola]BEI81228.1 hypothetical protein CcaverHIS002_0203880 [Cutaneotrichosporon cavernicola]BEI89022.1 hypothetical protein CcaverHIS019_0203840 [Cutaneotrichosporon cavernicola]BEI96798.1 hypothetical protein CcaverHIS631_0203870 [Cutaneotrichosporon cavernicola]BEJ04570.1 hypothetical protein CcaverHIS641_0203870 [Cutaneotrichosporon cavernicola]